MRLVMIALCIFISSTTLAQDNQLTTLPDSKTPRFDLADYDVWSDQFGQAQVCLWKDDKVGAVTITIDDNFEPEIDFWRSMYDNYGVPITWFVMVDHVKDWNTFIQLAKDGHDIQGHDLCNINQMDDVQYQQRLQHAADLVDKHLGEGQCIAFAYPCGEQRTEVSQNVYIAARGTYGIMNKANQINYLHVNSGGYNQNKRIDILLSPELNLYNQVYHRGWLSVHYHSIAKMKSQTEAYLSYVGQHKDQLWLAGFSEVAKYGQERDTHKITTLNADKNTVKLSLTDRMSDKLFDYPLTIRVRVNNDWQAARVIQGDRESQAVMIDRENQRFALIQAIPDAGEIQVIKQ